jgi:hypothetical protein
MAAYFGKNPDELLAMADKVAADVLAIIVKQPAYARFVRAHAHLTKDELETLARQLRAPQDKKMTLPKGALGCVKDYWS